MLSINIYLYKYFARESRLVVQEVVQSYPRLRKVQDLPKFRSLAIEERDRIQAIRRNDLRHIRRVSIFALAPLALASFGVGYYVSGQFLSPLNLLNKKISLLKKGNLGERLEKVSDDEIGELVDSYNSMSIRLKKAFESQEQFVQDASHELKTPLAIVYTNLDTIIDDKSATKKELRKSIKNALQAIKSMNLLLESLLTLASPDDYEFQKINLVDLVIDQISALSEYADQNGVAVRMISVDDFDKNSKLKLSKNDSEQKQLTADQVFILGDEFWLGRAIYNILENAIKYGADGGGEKSKVRSIAKVDITVGHKIISGKNYAKVDIVDYGPGIPESHAERIFDRFYRVDKSRSKLTGGFGLGLAIAKKVVEAHGGRIALDCSDTTTFSIFIPL